MVLWKMRILGKFYPSLEMSHNQLMGLGVSDFVFVCHIFAFLSSCYTFSSQAQILKCQSQLVSDLPFTTPKLITENILPKILTDYWDLRIILADYWWWI